MLPLNGVAMTRNIIGILDYRMGNLRSVQKALQRVGAEASIVSAPEQLTSLDKLILPGVGAFADGAEHLRQSGLDEAIRGFVATGRPFLGICLGMQLLFDRSEEDAPNAGLSLLPGEVVRFSEDRGGQRIKVPHMGWNTIIAGKPVALLDGIAKAARFYFVHSYAGPVNPFTFASCEHGTPFAAMVKRGNFSGVQFHPERSGAAGARLLQNFVEGRA